MTFLYHSVSPKPQMRILGLSVIVNILEITNASIATITSIKNKSKMGNTNKIAPPASRSIILKKLNSKIIKACLFCIFSKIYKRFKYLSYLNVSRLEEIGNINCLAIGRTNGIHQPIGAFVQCIKTYIFVINVLVYIIT